MINYFKNLKANYTVSAVTCMVVGLVLIIWPAPPLRWSAWFLAACFCYTVSSRLFST